MAKEVKLVVVEVKSLTHFVVKEYDTESAKEYEKFEELLHKTYSSPEDFNYRTQESIEVGSHVCVLLNADKRNKRAPKKWLRGVVRQILMSIGSYLYEVYLLDYGIQRMVQKSAVRELRPHFTEEFIKFQAINFHLSDTDLKPDTNTEENRKTIEDLFESNNSLVSALIIRETDTNLMGTVKLSDGTDLTQFLVDKGLATEKVFEIRKPRTSPLFKKSLPNGHQLKGHSTVGEAIDSDSSVSSISSAEISLVYDSSIESIDKSAQDIIIEKTVNRLSNNLNRLKGLGRGRGRGRTLNQMFTKIKERGRETDKMMSSSGDSLTVSSERSESPIEYLNQFINPGLNESPDWPQQQLQDLSRGPKTSLVPAGTQPPYIPPTNQRVFTLNKQK